MPAPFPIGAARRQPTAGPLRSRRSGYVLPRLLGVVLLALGIVIVQIIRHRLEVLYTTTLLVRVFIMVVLAALLVYSGDPLFISLMVVVGLGMVLTSASYLSDRRAKGAAAA